MNNVFKYYKSLFTEYNVGEESDYDNEIQLYILTSLADLSMAGVVEPMFITDWNSFTFDNIREAIILKDRDDKFYTSVMSYIISYIFANTKLKFDTPQYNSLKYFESLKDSSMWYVKNLMEVKNSKENE